MRSIMLNLQSIYFGQKHPDFDYVDFQLVRKISRLAKKHHRQAENSCNGVGVVNGQVYYGGAIDDYAKRQYGYGVKSAYTTDDELDIFTLEQDKIEDKINALLKDKGKFRVEYQSDPRGLTVKLYYENDFIEL